jgi:hypothetical protein
VKKCWKVKFHEYPTIIGSILLVIGGQYRITPIKSPTLSPASKIDGRTGLYTLSGHPWVKRRDLLGDWIQLVGISFVFYSLYAFSIAFVILPLLTYFITVQGEQENKAETDDAQVARLPAVWPGFYFLLRILEVVMLPVFIIALIHRDVTLFFGTAQDASSLLGTLAQVEATVVTLVVTLLL